jgi:hypothetical protein
LNDDSPGITRIADDVESADDPVPMQVTVVKLVLLHNVVFQPIQVLVCQQLSCKESGPAEAIDLAARGAWRRALLW